MRQSRTKATRTELHEHRRGQRKMQLDQSSQNVHNDREHKIKLLSYSHARDKRQYISVIFHISTQLYFCTFGILHARSVLYKLKLGTNSDGHHTVSISPYDISYEQLIIFLYIGYFHAQRSLQAQIGKIESNTASHMKS